MNHGKQNVLIYFDNYIRFFIIFFIIIKTIKCVLAFPGHSLNTNYPLHGQKNIWKKGF